MSEYNFGYDEPGESPELGETEQAPGPKALRDHLKKISSQLDEMKAENDRLRGERHKTEVETALKAKGFAPQAAGLFQGTPDKLDEWLTANGGALAKLPGDGQEQLGEQAPTGPPATTVPADGQEQLQRMQEQGTQGVAPPLGTDNEMAAAIAACQTPAEFEQLMQSQGNRFDWSA